jgi:hypothetical protein
MVLALTAHLDSVTEFQPDYIMVDGETLQKFEVAVISTSTFAMPLDFNLPEFIVWAANNGTNSHVCNIRDEACANWRTILYTYFTPEMKTFYLLKYPR